MPILTLHVITRKSVMDINKLKFGFASYLRTLKGDEEIKYDPTSDISIFQYAKEFKLYIKSKYSSDELNVSTMSIGDILDLELVNGKLTDPDKLEEEQGNNEEPPIEGEIPQETEEEKATFDESSVQDILNVLLDDEKFSSELDKDQNGDISKEELTNFFNTISINDDDGSNVSIDDILIAAENFAAENFNNDNTIPPEDTLNPFEDTIENPDIPSVNPANVSAAGSTGASGFSGNYNATPGQRLTSPTGPKSLDEMNAQELEAELTTANTDLAEKESNLEAIQNGTDDVVAPLKDAMENALNDYTEALENQNSQEAKELADVTKKIEEQETKQRENEELKQNCEDQIEIADKDIAHYDSVIQSCTDGISTLVTKIGDLQSQLNSVQDNSDDAAQYKAFIQAQIDQANIEKQKLEQEKQQAETAKGIAETKRDTAQQKLDNIENTITLTNEQIEELKSTQAELEEIVFKQNPELEQMKQNYLDAKDKYTTTRESEISRAKEEVKSAQDYVEKVSDKLTEVRKKDYEEDFSVVEMEDMNPLMKYNEKTGANIVNKAMELWGNISEYGGYCAGGVEKSILAATDVSLYGHAYQLADVLANTDGWEEVTDYYTLEDINKAYENGGLPPGAVLVWSQYQGGEYGHTFIADGKGGEISDCYKQQAVVNWYADRGATFRIFIPTT